MKVVSEGPVKITKATIDAAWRRRAASSRLVVRDKDCRGLALITNATTMTWSYSYRPRGTDPQTGRRWPNRTVFLGNPSSHSPDDARRAANQVEVMAGRDPSAERKTRAADLRRQRSARLGLLVEDYGITLGRRPKISGHGIPSPGYVASELVQVGHVDHVAVRRRIGHRPAEALREWLRLGPARVDPGGSRQRRHDVQPLAAGRLAEAHQAELREAVSNLLANAAVDRSMSCSRR